MAILCRLLLLLALSIILLATWIVSVRLPGLVILTVLFLIWRRRRGWTGDGWAHGTARFATIGEMLAHGLIGSRGGLILGRAVGTRPARLPAIRSLLLAPPWRSGEACRRFLAAFCPWAGTADDLIRLNRFVHLCTFAPTGRGKGTGFLIPNLLSWRGSTVTVDPKGENFQLTAAHRERVFGHRIIRLDSFDICGPGADRFNPLDLIEPDSPYLIDSARDLANALVIRTGKEVDPCWNDNAEIVLTAVIAYVAACETNPADRNLQTVRGILASRARYEMAIQAMQRSKACAGMLERYGHLLTWHVDRELGSILSSVHRHTSFLDSPAIAESTACSTFRLDEIRERPTSVYLCLPHDKLSSHQAVMRLWVTCLMRGVTRGPVTERNPVLFLLDEVAHIGQIKAITDAVTLMRGMGIRLWFFFQSIGQVRETFGDHASTIMDNCDTHIFFGLNAMESAETVSSRIGDATILVRSLQRGSGSSTPVGGTMGQDHGQLSDNQNWTLSEQGRRLVNATEVIRSPESLAYIFHRNLFPIRAWLVRYYEAPEFRGGRSGEPARLGRRALAASAFLLMLSASWLGAAVILPLALGTGVPGPRHMASGEYGRPPGGAPPYASGRNSAAGRTRMVRARRPELRQPGGYRR